ncbi:hypothetical protein B0H17DRAFT_1213275 [Mycena rosella]|uniref:Uncharacterized protein n=1 Tax=Mycena rosella TaxID=1033263 RepID=A0AAD7CQL3_MYCRO|nr:hypothetical protein B0H17DRAFT_1213275 [Mycena rosella]
MHPPFLFPHPSPPDAQSVWSGTNLPEDWWMAADFLIWRKLLSESTHSTWLSVTDLNQPMGVLGDPYANHLKSVLRMAGITLVPTLVSSVQDLFLALRDMVERAKPEDVVVVVLCSHGEPFASAAADSRFFTWRELTSRRLSRTSRWRSLKWTLLAAAEEHQMADEQGFEPTPGNMDGARTSFKAPRRSISDAHEFKQEFPTQLFTTTFLDRFQIFRPSPPDTTSNSDIPSSESNDFGILTTLATAFHKGRYPTTASNLPAILGCAKLLSGDTLPHSTQRALFSRLQYHAHACRRATAIAEFLEWNPTEPVEGWRRAIGLTRMKEGEAAGAKIMTAFISDTADGAQVGERQPLWRPLGTGEWLTEAWVAAGKPEVEVGKWEAALLYGNTQAGVSLNTRTDGGVEE